MDPGISWGRRSGLRLPRTRGDGPSASAIFSGTWPAPPHTRGWTRGDGRTVPVHRGSPAHAGMDHSDWGRRPACPWAPPHTRGWTHVQRRKVTGPDGSPAHAGMDPARLRCGRRTGRLPRTRGDGPHTSTNPTAMARAPPHTRGWTPEPQRVPLVDGGSPAHAGMDPRAGGGATRSSGLPRTRGDGPGWHAGGLRLHRAPPHTRGWTHRRHGRAGLGAGSPAHAGMDPP